MVEFVSELDQADNKIRDRRPPDPDRSSLVMSEAFTNLGSTLGAVVKPFLTDSKSEAYGELENELQLNVIETGLKQGRITQDEAFLRSESSLKKVIAKYPTLAPELREYAKGKLGFNPTEKLLGNLMQEDANMDKINQDIREQNLKEAAKVGDDVYNDDGTLDVDTTLSNYEETKATNQIIQAQKNRFEAGKISQAEFENNFKATYVSTVGKKVNNMVSNMYKNGVMVDGKLTPLNLVPKEKLAGIIQQASAQLKLGLNNELAKARLSPEAIKELQITTDSFLTVTESIFLGKDEAELKQIEKNIKIFNANSTKTFQDQAPILAAQTEVFGKEATGGAVFEYLYSGPARQKMAEEIGSLFSTLGKPTPTQYNVGNIADTALAHVQQSAIDPKYLSTASDTDIKITVPSIIRGVREAWKTPNNMTEKGDKTYVNMIANLASVGNKSNVPSSDVKKIMKELTNPAQVQTFKAVQARGVDAVSIRAAGEQQGQFILDRLPRLETDFFANYKEFLDKKVVTLNRDVVSGKLYATVDKKKYADLKSQPSPLEAGLNGVGFFVGVNTDKAANELNASINSELNLINQAVNTVTSLKDFSEYGSLKDQEFRDVIQNTKLLKLKEAIGYSMPKEEKKMKAVTGDGKELLIPALPDLEDTLLDQIDSGETNSN